MKTQTWLLWDGECDFCREAANWLERHDPASLITIIPYQQAPSPPMTPALRVLAQRAVQLVSSDGARRSGAEAVLFALRSVGWHPAVMMILLRRPMLWGAEVVYQAIARNRSTIARLFVD